MPHLTLCSKQEPVTELNVNATAHVDHNIREQE